MKCLLIQTKDKRKFFTHEKNFVQLIEFSKTFNAEVSVVKIESGPILELEELAPAICDSSYTADCEYKLIENKFGKIRTRTNTLQNANKIKNYILEKFQTRNPVSLLELKKKFGRYKLSDAALCNHLRKAKEELEKQGTKIIKVKAGVYQCMI